MFADYEVVSVQTEAVDVGCLILRFLGKLVLLSLDIYFILLTVIEMVLFWCTFMSFKWRAASQIEESNYQLGRERLQFGALVLLFHCTF